MRAMLKGTPLFYLGSFVVSGPVKEIRAVAYSVVCIVQTLDVLNVISSKS
jgi:hypothetical protein